MRRDRPEPTSQVGRLLTDLQSLRKGNGLTRTKVARAQTLCGLPVVTREADRLHLAPEEVAYRLLIAAVYGLKDARSRDFLINALALEHTPPGQGLTDRRRRYAGELDESRVRDHEDEALEEVARWLLAMEHPEVLFGDYAFDAFVPPPAEWNIGTLTAPSGLDDIHPREELVWDFLEKTTILDDRGSGIATETRGLARAAIDGVTGYTLHYTSNTGSRPTGIHLIRGGRPGHKHPLGPLDTYRLNIDFERSLAKSQTVPLHWILELNPGRDARPVHGLAQAPEVPTRDLTLRAQFADGRLPVRPCYFVAQPDHLPQPEGPKRPLKLMPGNLIAKSWRAPERQKVYVISWEWPGDAERLAQPA